MGFKYALLGRCDFLVSVELTALVVSTTADVGFGVCSHGYLNVLALLYSRAELLAFPFLWPIVTCVESIVGCGPPKRVIHSQVVGGKGRRAWS